MINNFFPNDRLVQETLNCPIFVSDIQNATNQILVSMQSLGGLTNDDFYIISGLEYQSGPNNYSPGVVWMYGQFYATDFDLTPGKYLNPDVTDVESKLHSDDNSYYTYRLYKAKESNTPYMGSPVFNMLMNDYRLNLKILNTRISDRLTDLSTPWTAPTLNTGFTNDGTYPVQYRLNQIGQVQIRGKFTVTGSPANFILFTLPVSYRPLNQPSFQISMGGYITIVSHDWKIDTNGEVSIMDLGSWPSGFLGYFNIQFEK